MFDFVGGVVMSERSKGETISDVVLVISRVRMGVLSVIVLRTDDMVSTIGYNGVLFFVIVIGKVIIVCP